MDGHETLSPSALETLIPQRPTEIHFSPGHMQELVRNINIRRAIETSRDEILGGENPKGFSVSADVLTSIVNRIQGSDQELLIDVIGQEAAQADVDDVVDLYSKMITAYSPDGPFDEEKIMDQDALVIKTFAQNLALRGLPDHWLPQGFKEKDLETSAAAFQQKRTQAKAKGMQFPTYVGE